MKYRFNIINIDCPTCAGKLQELMAKAPGVDSAKINFLTEKLTVESSLSEGDLLTTLRSVARSFSKSIVVEK